jgi:hypothetical protein
MRTWRASSKLLSELRPMDPREGQVAPLIKVEQVEMCLEVRSTKSLVPNTNTRDKRKVESPTKGNTKGESHSKPETKVEKPSPKDAMGVAKLDTSLRIARTRR